jgi:hypothetical protein
MMNKSKVNNGGTKTKSVLAQNKGGNKTKSVLAQNKGESQKGEIDVRARMKKFKKVDPPKDPVVNLDNQTAMACLKQISDIGMIGQMEFTMTTPSKSDYASYNPSILYYTTRPSREYYSLARIFGVLV